jgi:hypothetical protein
LTRHLSDLAFPYASRLMPDGQRRGHVGIECKTCGREEWRIAKNPGLGNRIFTSEGWHLGSRRGHDECPTCVEARLMPAEKRKTITLKPMKKETEVVPTTATTPAPPMRVNGSKPPTEIPVAEPPRQPTWADNRRIRQDLDLAYDADAGRYFNNNTDESVAQRLNVPRAWVSTIRELYGPDRCEDDDLRAKALISVLEAARKSAAEAEKAATVALEQADAASRMVALILKSAKDAGLDVAA